MDAAQIRAALPQRHPLLLVDRVLTREPGRRIETLKAITATEPCYAHLPDGAAIDDYAYPVSLLIESFGQSAALLWLDDSRGDTGDRVLLFVGARGYTVEGRAFPGDVVRHVVHLEKVIAETAFATGESWVGERRIATVGTLLAARRRLDLRPLTAPDQSTATIAVGGTHGRP